MNKLFYGLSIVSLVAAVILAVVSYRYGQTPTYDQSAATAAATVWYGMMAASVAACAFVWLAIARALEHLEDLANSARHIAHNTAPKKQSQEPGW